MQFAQIFPSMETPRPSVFGQFLPMGSAPQEPPASWLQVPPTHMPWGIPMANQPSIVRFTAERPDKQMLSGTMPFTQCKRKIEPDMELPGVKQHITEEKMAAHMSQLHISADYTPHQPEGGPEREGEVLPQPGPSREMQYKRLVLCEEIRQLQNEPILPSALLAKMEKPTMALVLWQPPAGNIGEALRNAAMASAGSSKTDCEEEERRKQQLLHPASTTAAMSAGPVFPILDNNNTSAAVDLNSLALPGFGQPPALSASTQAMDL